MKNVSCFPAVVPATRDHFSTRATALARDPQTGRLAARSAVRPVADPAAWQRCRLEPIATPYPEIRLDAGDTLVLDFGEHCVGRVTLRLEAVQPYPYHAPLWLELFFAEVLAETGTIPPGVVRRATLAESWIPEESIRVDEFPATVELPRRHAFRYLKATVRAFSGTLRLAEATVIRESAVLHWQVPPPQVCDPELNAIDRVGIATLRDCMQRVFEDGPRRDRRLWGGDLRLQALVNAVSFRDFELMERSLYLLAAGINHDGMVPGCVFDRGAGIGGNLTVTYALLFGTMLDEHLAFSGRRPCVEELFPLALHQLELVRRLFDADGRPPCPIPDWPFIDHCPELDVEAAFTGTFLFSLNSHARLARRLGAPEIATRLDAERIERQTRAHAIHYDPATGLAISNGQYSYASQIWLALGGALTPEEARTALRRIAERPDAVRPKTPYLWHYMLEALFACGLDDAAWDLIRRYWGGMVRHGADTFWEAYVPEDDFFSPYGDFRLNSACHAWSCTPSFFIRTRATPQ